MRETLCRVSSYQSIHTVRTCTIQPCALTQLKMAVVIRITCPSRSHCYGTTLLNILNRLCHRADGVDSYEDHAQILLQIRNEKVVSPIDGDCKKFSTRCAVKIKPDLPSHA